jgi:translation initiation factor 5B
MMYLVRMGQTTERE